MRAYKYRTHSDLQRFTAAHAALAAHLAEQEAFAGLALSTVAGDGPSDAGNAFGLVAMQSSTEQLEAAVALFEPAAVRFLGEGRRAGERAADYLKRLHEEIAPEGGIRAMQRRNGLMLLPW